MVRYAYPPPRDEAPSMRRALKSVSPSCRQTTASPSIRKDGVRSSLFFTISEGWEMKTTAFTDRKAKLWLKDILAVSSLIFLRRKIC